jgi:hypothetical protein
MCFPRRGRVRPGCWWAGAGRACCGSPPGTRISPGCGRPVRGSAGRDDPRDRLPAAVDAKIGVIRAAAADRFGSVEINAFGTVVVTGQRRAETEDLVSRRGWAGIGVQDVRRMPAIFIGSPDQIRSDLAGRRDRFGLPYLVAGADSPARPGGDHRRPWVTGGICPWLWAP